MTRIMRTALLPALAVALLATACSSADSDDDSAPAPSTTETGAPATAQDRADEADADTDFAAPTGDGHDKQAALDLEGRDFTSTVVEGPDLVSGSVITAYFGEGMVAVDAGCNNLGGIYTFDGTVLTVAQVRSTRMACDPELEAQDRRLIELLESGIDADATGDTLTLTSGETTIVFTDRG